MALLQVSVVLTVIATLLDTSLAAPQHVNTTRPFIIEPRISKDRSCRCGQKGASRIVGGQNAQVNEWPWIAVLMVRSFQNCGGSLINNRYILTAAHCVYEWRARDLSVRLAEHRLSTSGETQLVTRSVKRIITHPNYNSMNQRNDIALLELSQAVQVNDAVLPVCMPPPRPLYSRQAAKVIGWGNIRYDGPAADILQEVTVKVWSNRACQRGNYGNAIKDTMLCASSSGKDACQGDSGGPLLFQDGQGNYDQIGVVSWGYGCAEPRYPGVYTRVNKYLDWIKANTANAIYCIGSNFP